MHLIDDERVDAAMGFAVEICCAPGVYPDGGPFEPYASADAIGDYVKSKVAVPIHIWDVAFEGRIVGSRLERYKDRIEIAVCAKQDDRWKRFCAIKELVHIIIDKEVDLSGYGNDRIEELLNKGLIGLASGANPTQEATQSELVAEICAIEIMYPATQVLKDLESHNGDVGEHRKSVKRIALERRMPDFFTSTALNADFRKYVAEATRRCQERRSS